MLTAIVSWVGGSPKSPRKLGRTRAGKTDLHVGGLYDGDPNVHVYPRWVNRNLRAGDEVSIRIVHGTNPDEPREKTVQTDDEIRERQRQYNLRVNKQFEGQNSDHPPKRASSSRKSKPPRSKSKK